jgi:hypothetical protein
VENFYSRYYPQGLARNHTKELGTSAFRIKHGASQIQKQVLTTQLRRWLCLHIRLSESSLPLVFRLKFCKQLFYRRYSKVRTATCVVQQTKNKYQMFTSLVFCCTTHIIFFDMLPLIRAYLGVQIMELSSPLFLPSLTSLSYPPYYWSSDWG